MTQPIDYTNRDYASLRQAMLDDAVDKLPEWTSRSANDFGVVLIEEFAYMGDILSYYIDRAANESFLPTATLLQSVLNIAAMLDYRPDQGSPSRATLTFTADVGSGTVYIPAGTQVQAVSPDPDKYAVITFETDADLYIPQSTSAENSGSITATQGETISNESLGTSDGTASQEFALSQTPVIEGSVQLEVSETSNGFLRWTFVDHLVDAGPNDAVYTTATDATGVTSVIFGDGVNGRIPLTDASIQATYRVGGGAVTNVGPGTITQLVSPITGLASGANSPIVTNLQAAEGGTDPETIDQIRVNAPRSLTTLHRGVTLNDYANLALLVPGVAKAKAFGWLYTGITIYIAPLSGASASDVLKAQILQYLSDKKMANASLTIADPTYVPVNVTASVFIGDAFTQTAVVQNAKNAIAELLDFDTVDFGSRISLNDVYAALAAVPGVVYSQVSQLVRVDGADQSVAADVITAPNEIPTGNGGVITVSIIGGGIPVGSGAAAATGPTVYYIPDTPGAPVVDSSDFGGGSGSYTMQLHWASANNATTYAVIADYFDGSTYLSSEKIGVFSAASGLGAGHLPGTADTVRLHVQAIDGPNVTDGPPTEMSV